MSNASQPPGAASRTIRISNSISPEKARIPEESGLPYRTMSELFAHVWPDGAPGNPEFVALDEKPLSQRYAICLIPRSGSTYLAHLLRDTGAFGNPNEWLAVGLAEDLARRTGAADWDTLLRRTLAMHASPNGVSGIELALAHIVWGRQATGRKQVLDRTMRYFYLRRRNIVRQAISMFMAHQSGILHSFQLDQETQSARDQVSYNAASIRGWVKFLQDEEMRWEREFGALGIEPVRLYYEDVIARPERVIRLFAHLLGVPETPQVPERVSLTRMSDERSDAWEIRYREEDADFLQATKRYRPLLHTLTQTT